MARAVRVIGNGDEALRFGKVRIVLSERADGDAAELCEEDTWQVLSAVPEVVVPDAHPLRLFRALHDAQPLAPGTVLTEAGVPLLLRAVVYDFDAEPCCRPEWVSAALHAGLQTLARHGLQSLALPPLAVRHGGLPLPVSIDLLLQALQAHRHHPLRRLRLLVAEDTVRKARELLCGLA